jgi:uncharacterized protein (TIGR02588 family)
MARTAKKGEAESGRRTRVLAALGLAFVLGSFALMLREAFTAGKPVAELTIRIDEILPSNHGYLVSLIIENRGGATATALVVEGVLRKGGQDVETSLLTVDYVPAGSRRDVALFFASDPQQGDLIVRPKGYIEP